MKCTLDYTTAGADAIPENSLNGASALSCDDFRQRAYRVFRNERRTAITFEESNRAESLGGFWHWLSNQPFRAVAIPHNPALQSLALFIDRSQTFTTNRSDPAIQAAIKILLIISPVFR